MDRCITQDPFTFEAPKGKPFASIIAESSATPETLEFNLFIHNPSAESSLTPSWDVPDLPLRVSRATRLDTLLVTLRSKLPPSPNRPKRPLKLAGATLYWTYRGDIVPLQADEKDWYYKNAFIKSDLLGRTELQWYDMKEMILASEGALKCYLAIRGEEEMRRGWWFFGKGRCGRAGDDVKNTQRRRGTAGLLEQKELQRPKLG
ncbi:Fc.00g030930.m01.CDS01 [Cosmosporella sp. VM-42]